MAIILHGQETVTELFHHFVFPFNFGSQHTYRFVLRVQQSVLLPIERLIIAFRRFYLCISAHQRCLFTRSSSIIFNLGIFMSVTICFFVIILLRSVSKLFYPPTRL